MAKRRTINLQFPAGGVDRGLSYQNQQPYVTPLAMNVRPRESREGRLRGGSRPMLEKYSDTHMGPIAALEAFEYFQLGSGVDAYVTAIESYGDDIFIAGNFTTAGGDSATRIVRYNTITSEWSELVAGSGPDGVIHALKVVNDYLYAGGSFSFIGYSPYANIARFHLETQVWLPLGVPIYPNGAVWALEGIGTDLYVGGAFTTVPGASASRIAKYDTNAVTWSALGVGVDSTVYAIKAIGTDLYVGGLFVNAGGTGANRIAKYDTVTPGWSALGNGTSSYVCALDAIGTDDLYVGGDFTTADAVTVNHIAKYNISTTTWSALGAGTPGVDDTVRAITHIGSYLYAGGSFLNAGGVGADYLARWNGTAWSAVDSGIDDVIYALSPLWEKLYIGGEFTTAGGMDVGYVAGYTPEKFPVRMIATCNTAVTAEAQQWSYDWKYGAGDWETSGVVYFSGSTIYNNSFQSPGSLAHSLPIDMDISREFSISAPVLGPVYPLGGVAKIGYGFEEPNWATPEKTFAWIECERDGGNKRFLKINCYKVEDGSSTLVYYKNYIAANDATFPMTIKLAVIGMYVSYYFNDALLHTELISGSFTGNKIALRLDAFDWQAWQLQPSYIGMGPVAVDYYTVSYTASSTKSIFSAGGNVYLQDSETATPTEITPLVAGYHSISPLHPVNAVEMYGKLYIADYSTPRKSGSDGGFAGGTTKFDTGAAFTWNTFGDATEDTAIIPGSDVLVISGGSDVDGVYLITVVGANDLTISPAIAIAHVATDLNYRIMRSPKVLDLGTNTLSVWKSLVPATDGWVPAGCPLIARYAGRIYLAGEANNPHIWYACEMGNALDWNYSAVADTGAIAGTTAEYAVIASPLTALCPINEDIMLMTAVDEVWTMPPNLRVAGTISNLSQEVGCVGVNAWTTTPEGRFIFLARGGIYIVDPTSGQFQSYAAQPFSHRPLPKELKNVIESNFWISMAYDCSDQSIHLYLTPRGGGAGTHWVIDWETRGPVQYVFRGDYQPCVVGPSCAGTFLLGGMDGYLRKYDADANNDDGAEVESTVMIGPFPLASPGYEGVVHCIRGILGELSGDVTWELYVGDTAEAAYRAALAITGSFAAGRSYSTYPMRRGTAAIIKLIATGQWEMESIEMDIDRAGLAYPS